MNDILKYLNPLIGWDFATNNRKLLEAWGIRQQ